jgi:hypothetical protein
MDSIDEYCNVMFGKSWMSRSDSQQRILYLRSFSKGIPQLKYMVENLINNPTLLNNNILTRTGRSRCPSPRYKKIDDDTISNKVNIDQYNILLKFYKDILIA